MLLVLPYPTMTFLPFYVAEEKGLFERQGVKVRCIHSRDGKQRFVQLALEGEVAFYTSMSTTVEAILRGWGEVRALCANTVAHFPCVVRPEIKSMADLKGKKIMVGGGRSKNEALYICSIYGWQPGKDIEIVSQGDAIGRIHAFKDPNIFAVFARVQYLSWGEKEGFRALPYPTPGTAWCEGGLATSLQLIRENPELVQKVVTAVAEATEFVKNSAEEAIAVALKRIQYLDRAAAEDNYRVLHGAFSCDIEAPAIEYMAEVLGMVKKCPRKVMLEEIADLSFLQRALNPTAHV